MTSPVGKANTAVRQRDSELTRQALLDAGRALFDEVGYERATTREIGVRGGVDPALIARYFGGKEALFLAVIADRSAAEARAPESFEPNSVLAFLLEHWDEPGHGPIRRALASPTLGDDVRAQVRAVVGERLVEPLSAELTRDGRPQPELRAELLVALALGVAITRANGTLADLAAASREEVIAALAPLADALST